MSRKKKKKRDLYSTFQHIERFHRRRSVFVFHSLLSLIFQAAMWVNWYTSYAVRGVGFDDNFFTPRLIISIVLIVFLAAHLTLMRLTEYRDRLVIRALQLHDDELEPDDDDLQADDDEDRAEMDIDADRSARLIQR